MFMFTYILICIVVIINLQLLAAYDGQILFKDHTNTHENHINFGESQNINEYFQTLNFGIMPLINLTASSQITPKCRLQSIKYIRNLQNLSFWAVKMYDSSAKLPSGILNGNLNQLGDFDECINSHSDDNAIIGQYCLANFQIAEPTSQNLTKFYSLLNSHFAFRNKLENPGHLAPRFASINWAICVPSSCTYEDVEIALKDAIKPLEEKFGLSIQIKVFEEMCQIADKPILLSSLIGCVFFVTIIVYTIIITIIDFYYLPLNNLNGLQGILFAFSLRRTVKSFFSLERIENDIPSVHGVRFINAMMLLIAHYGLNVLFVPYMNRTYMAEMVGQPWTVVARNAAIYTDIFLMLSGLLTIHSYYGKINNGKEINFFKEYLSRLMRIVPPLAAVILFFGLVQSLLGSGPFWSLVIGQNANACKYYGWRNLLSIQNYFGFENMCAAHTHHVGTDTQLFFVAPLFLWLLWKWQTFGIIILIILATLSTILRYYVAYSMGLTLYMYFGMQLDQMFDAADNIYLLPTHRATVYIIGVLLGYILQNLKHVELTSLQLKVGNIIAFLMFGIGLIAPSFMSVISYKFKPIDGAWYVAFAPILWCLSFAWLIFIQHFNYRNTITTFLSWRGFIIFTRFSYAFYLIQFPVFFYNIGTTRNSKYFHIFKLVPSIEELILMFLIAIILTLLFDTPFQTIRRIYFKKYETKTVNTKDVFNLTNNNSVNKKTD